jgi:uncharacterized membrane protein YfcA
MLIIAGFLTGILVGMTGVGGGALMTPLLLFVFGVAPNFAVGTDLWFAVFTKSIAAKMHYGSKLVDWQVVRRLWLGSLPGACLCLLWLHFYPDVAGHFGFLKLSIAYAVMLMAVGMLFQERLHRIGQHWRLSEVNQFKQWQAPLTIFSGVLLGVLVSLTSIGAGALGAVMLNYLYPLRLTPSRLIATDIVHAIPLALFAGLGHLMIGNVDFLLLFYLLLGSIPGVVLGVKLSARFSPVLLRWILALVLLGVGSKLWLSS